MSYLQLWRHDNHKHATEYYECSRCPCKYIDERVCFKYDLVSDDDTVEVDVPYKDEDGKWQREVRQLDRDGVLEMLDEIDQEDPSTPAFELLINKMLNDGAGNRIEICPIGLMDDDAWDVIALESFCDKYGMAPCNPPVVDEQPPVLVEMFMMIQSEKNRYQAIKLERTKKSKK